MSKIGRITICSFVIFIFACLPAGRAFVITAPALAEVKAGVDKTSVALDSTVKYTIEISGNEENPGLPKLTNLRVISSYQSSNISIINGQTSTSKSFTYMLQPEKVGLAEVGRIEITVTSAEGRQSQPRSRVHSRLPGIWEDFDEFFSSPFPRFRQRETVKNPVRVGLKASRTTAYVNQQILLTFTFYRRVNLFQSPSYSPPDTTGFWAINLPAKKGLREVDLDGVKYLAQDFKTVLFPTTPGNFTIGPASLVVQTDPFAAAQTIRTRPLKVKVLPLPEEGRPESFSGSVGQYQMKVWIKDKEIERGQPVQVTAKIWGEGNIQTISEPVCSLPGEFKKLSSSAKENLIKGKYAISGSKIFEIIMIPLKAGHFTLPDFKFSYFDPLRKQYQTIKSESFELDILPSSKPLPREFARGLAAETEKKPVAIVIPWRKIGHFMLAIFTSRYFWTPILTLVFGVLVFFTHGWYQKKINADPVKLRYRRALKTSRRRFKRSYALLKKERFKEFVAEIFKSVTDYLGDKYNFSSAGLTTDSLMDILSGRGISSNVRQQIDVFISECDLFRFTPLLLNREKAEELARLAEQLIVTIERNRVA